jgi:hypothetical protein
MSPTTAWWKSLCADVVEAGVMGGPAGTEFAASGGELADEVREVAVEGVAAGCRAQYVPDIAGAIPAGIDLAGAGVEEDVSGAVDRTGAGAVSLAEHVGVEAFHGHSRRM